MRALAAFLVASALALPANAETRDLGGFNAVSASGNVDVEIRQGAAFRVDIDGPRVERVEMRVSGDWLQIETRNQNWFAQRGNGPHARITITMPVIRALDSSAGAEVTALGVSADALALDASSGSDVEIAGSCSSLSVDASSGASINARGLNCRDVEVDASSGADVTLLAQANFDIDASSGASIRWGGEGRIRNVDLSSGASVRRFGN